MRIGILGGGQLAQMMALAGHPLGIRFALMDPSDQACALSLGTALTGDYGDGALLDALAADCDVVTYEFENVPIDGLERLARQRPMYPSASTLRVCQDRLLQKQLFDSAGVPAPAFEAVATLEELAAAVDRLRAPLVLKARRGGYDGRGQAVIRSANETDGAWLAIGERPAIVEKFVPFDREVSMIGARSREGAMAFYPVSENVHREGILRFTSSRPDDPAVDRARELLGRLMNRLGHVGVATLEMFEVDGALYANELASRVHNSGHWTIEGAMTSQFENHLRAIAGWPLGDTSAVGLAAMINCIGTMPLREAVLRQPGAHLHAYGKTPRPGRKIGHVTVRAKSEQQLRERLEGLCAAFPDLPGLIPETPVRADR